MNGRDGLNTSGNGVVTGQAWLRPPAVATPVALSRPTDRAGGLGFRARRNLARMDLRKFPATARAAADRGEGIRLRTAGHAAPIRAARRATNLSDRFGNPIVTASVRICGSDGTFDPAGAGTIVNAEGALRAHQTRGTPCGLPAPAQENGQKAAAACPAP